MVTRKIKEIIEKKKEKKENKKKESPIPIKKSLANDRVGIIHILPKKNNMIFTLTNIRGNKVAMNSAGTLGYKNAQKKTWLAVREGAKDIGKQSKNHGFTKLKVNFQNHCPKRGSALRGLQSVRCKIIATIYRALDPHNGCPGPKKRRK